VEDKIYSMIQRKKQDLTRFATRYGWRWVAGKVNTAEEHIQISYGKEKDANCKQLPKIAFLSPPKEKNFTLQFLLTAKGPKEQDMIREVRRELNYYLVEKREENPWAYAKYHCRTAANLYSKVHWSFFPKGWKDTHQKEDDSIKKRHKKLSVVSVVIELAERDDLSAILDIIRDYQRYDVEFAKRYYDIYFRKDKITEQDKVFVAKINGKTIGVSGFCRDYFSTDYSYWLGWFIVDEEYRGKKEFAVAKKLLKRVEAELQKRKIKKLLVSTEDTNQRAIRFYTKNHFSTEAVIRDYYGRGEDQLILSKVITER
jgi:ribosomal protein S18 acetylase RimI-like enzyme